MALLAPGSHPGGGGRPGRFAGAARLLLCALLAPLCAAAAEPPVSREFQIKAVFLLNFAQFVQWPAAAFADAEAPLRIGLVGDDPFRGVLAQAVRDETVRNRRIVVEHLDRLADVARCHILFVSASERANIGAILAAVGDKPILTVADLPGFARQGGAINFLLEGAKVRFEINPTSAQAHGLKLHAQLLSLARIVPGSATPGGD